MSNSVHWQIHALGSLSLFDRVNLDARKIDALPREIREELFGGYTDILNSPQMASFGSGASRIQFAAKTTEQGEILLSHDRGNTFVSAGKLDEFPRLKRAMWKACDAARIQFPAAFRTQEPIGEMFDFVPAEKSPIVEPVGIGLDVNAVARNFLCAAKVAAPLIAVSGFAAGGAGLVAGAAALKEGKRQYSVATSIGDKEGRIQAALKMAKGFFCEVTSLGMLGSFLPSTYALFPGQTNSLVQSNVAFGYSELANASVMGIALALLASTLYEWKYVSEFRSRLGTILERDGSEQKKAIEGLEFLQQQLALSVEDLGDLKEFAFDGEAVEHKYREKYDRLVRRVGPEVAAKIANSIELLQAVKKGDSEAIQQAKELIEQADFESFKKRVKEITYLVVFALTIAAAVISVALLGEEARHLLYAVDAIICLSVDSSALHDRISKKFYDCLKPSEEKRWGTTPASVPEKSEVA